MNWRDTNNQMRVVDDVAELGRHEPIALTIGVFDGVHRGHQALIRETARLASARGYRPVVLTFWPHPITVLRPGTEVRYLNMLDERLEQLAALDLLAAAIVMPFTPGIADTPAGTFLDTLRDALDLRLLVAGANFALGRHRTGNLDFLRTYGQQHDMDVVSVELAQSQGERISSTHIRELLMAGDVKGANRLLGYGYMLHGTVVMGDQRGHTVGFPTANLALDPQKLVPANGVYAVRCRIVSKRTSQPSAPYDAVMNIGVRPTFDGQRRTVEVHLLLTGGEGATFDLYGDDLRVELVTRLRPEHRFANIEALRAQIQADIAAARDALAESEQNDETALEV
jgi:riboflavin kinase/FMN adenylyltransferase